MTRRFIIECEYCEAELSHCNETELEELAIRSDWTHCRESVLGRMCPTCLARAKDLLPACTAVVVWEARVAQFAAGLSEAAAEELAEQPMIFRGPEMILGDPKQEAGEGR